MSESKAVLIELDAGSRDKFLEMAQDFKRAGESRFQDEAADFDAYLEQLEMYRTGDDLPDGDVASTTFFLLDGEKLVGRSSLRHELSESLAVFGGHLGYTVRPSERRKGYGSLILRLTVEKARARGLTKVFVTCDTDNTASAKIIEKNGGKLAGQIFYEVTGKLVSQYWIELN